MILSDPNPITWFLFSYYSSRRKPGVDIAGVDIAGVDEPRWYGDTTWQQDDFTNVPLTLFHPDTHQPRSRWSSTLLQAPPTLWRPRSSGSEPTDVYTTLQGHMSHRLSETPAELHAAWTGEQIDITYPNTSCRVSKGLTILGVSMNSGIRQMV